MGDTPNNLMTIRSPLHSDTPELPLRVSSLEIEEDGDNNKEGDSKETDIEEAGNNRD